MASKNKPGCNCCDKGCGELFASGALDPPITYPFFADCTQANGACTYCDVGSATGLPIRLIAQIIGAGSAGPCTEADGDNANRDYVFTGGSCTLSSSDSVQLCGALRTVSGTFTIGATTATVEFDFGALGTAIFSKALTTPSDDCHADLAGTYAFSSYSGTALDFSGAHVTVHDVGCGIATYWTLVSGSIIPDFAQGNGYARSVGDFVIEMNDDTLWPQRSSAKWEARFFPEADGDSFSIFMGIASGIGGIGKYEARFTATEGLPTLELYQWLAGVATLVRRKINHDASFTFPDGIPGEGIVLMASLCRNVLLVQAPHFIKYDDPDPLDPDLPHPDHDSQPYLYRPLILSSGGGGPGGDVTFYSGKWGLGGSGDFVFGAVHVFNTIPDIEAGCPPDTSCTRLLTEIPIEFQYSIQNITSAADDGDRSLGHVYVCDCDPFNGSFSDLWTGGVSVNDCVYETFPNSIVDGCSPSFDCQQVGTGTVSECVNRESGMDTGGWTVNLSPSVGQTLTWTLPPATIDAIPDDHGDLDSLGAPNRFWKPDDVNYDKWHFRHSAVSDPTSRCGIANAEMKIDGFTFEDSD